MKYVALIAALLVGSFLTQEAQADGPGFAPLQARRVAGQNLRFSARQGRANFVANGNRQFQAVRVAPVIVPGCVGAGCFQPLGVAPVMFRSQTIIVR